MADGIQLGAGEQPASSTDNNSGSANAPGAGERSTPLMARPEWVPEKFFKDGVIDYKGMATSYQELEKKQGQKPEGSEQKPTGEQKPAEQKPAAEQKQDEQTPPPATIPGVKPERIQAFTGELQKDGKLSDSSYKELAELGYPKPVVDAYVRGLNADNEVTSARLADTQIKEIKDSVGGEDQLNTMLGWAAANWSAADLKVYNDAVSSRDVSKVKMAVQGLKAAYAAENGEEPNYLDLGGNRKPAAGLGLEPYGSEDDVAKDMANPLYHRSPDFRKKVEDRLRISDVFRNSRDVTKVQR